MTLGFARKEPHESGLSRDLLAMTSHNSGEAQGRPGSPHSASGGLRRGRFPPLRSGPIPHRELCDVMPSPEAGGRSRARPQYIPRCAVGFTNALASWRVVLVASSCGRPATMLLAARKYQPPHAPVRWLLASSGRGRSQRARPCGPDHAGCWPGVRGLRSFVAAAAPQKQMSGGTRGPRNRRACACHRKR